MSTPLSVRDWSPAAGCEPVVRVGIVLDEDGDAVVRLTTPAGPCRLESATGPPRTLPPGTAVTATRAGGGLRIEAGGAAHAALGVRLTPLRGELAPGQGTGVHGVVAGRGFHWQRRIDVTLGGVVELRPGRRGVVVVNELPLEDYLAGVITAEMSGACPAALLEAQCVVARSWLLAMTEPKHADAPFDRCNDDCCQRYQGTDDLSATALAAVRRTRGVLLRSPSGGVLDANYAKSCGGISETPVAVWGLAKPGITPVVDAPPDAPERRFYPITEANLEEYLDGEWVRTTRCYCSPNVVPRDAIGRYLGRVDTPDDYFRWTKSYGRAELEALLRTKLGDADELVELCDLRVRARGVSGRAYIVEAQWRDAHGAAVVRRIESEYRIRQVLHPKFLYSSAFAVRPERDADGRLTRVTLRGAGWGHGVGLCQIGALGMALSGHDYQTICRHYYPRATLARVY